MQNAHSINPGWSTGTIEGFSTRSPMKNPRIQITLGPLILKDLEAYAASLGNTTANEAGRMVTDRILQLRDEGKIPPSATDSKADGDRNLMQTYLKLLTSGTPVPDEIIKWVASETGLSEADLKTVSETCVAQTNKKPTHPQ